MYDKYSTPRYKKCHECNTVMLWLQHFFTTKWARIAHLDETDHCCCVCVLLPTNSKSYMETRPQLKVSSDRLAKPRIKPTIPGLQGEQLSTTPRQCLRLIMTCFIAILNLQIATMTPNKLQLYPTHGSGEDVKRKFLILLPLWPTGISE